jgi:hypothetical protein
MSISKVSEFLKHPFLLMCVGTIALTIFTNHWTGKEQRNLLSLQFQRSIIEKQLNLLDRIPAQYHRSATYLNTWFQYLISVGEELAKPPNERDKPLYDFCLKKGQEAEEKYKNEEPFAAKLDQVKVIFKTDEVKKVAISMDEKLYLFIEKVASSVRCVNSRKLKENDLKEWEKFRKKTIDELSKMHSQLTELMVNEIIVAYKDSI